jgi:hypothetical protein
MKKFLLFAMLISAASFSLDGNARIQEVPQIDGYGSIVFDHPDVIFYISYHYIGNEATIYDVSAINRNVNGPEPVITGWSGSLQYTGLDVVTSEPTFCFGGYIKTDLTGKVTVNCGLL